MSRTVKAVKTEKRSKGYLSFKREKARVCESVDKNYLKSLRGNLK